MDFTTWKVYNHQEKYLTRFIDLKNLYNDTKIIVLPAPEAEIWSIIYDGGHFGGHLGFLKMLKGANLAPVSFR